MNTGKSMTYKILTREKLAEGITKMVILSPETVRNAQAGQFCVIMANENGERIPLTIADFDKEKGTLTFIFQEVGFSTKKLGSMKPGDSVAAVLGPLGKATHVEKLGTVFCIGGGVGIAEMLPVALAYKKAGNRIIGIIGARTKELLILEVQLRSVCDELLIATDDGSVGVKGFVTDILSARLEKDMPCLVYAVGPVLMMEKVAAMTRPNKIKTIGDDLQQITRKAKDDGKVPEGKYVVFASTPSFIGSHITGYANMVTGIATQFAVSTGVKKNQFNIIAGWMEPSDMREIKRLSKELGVKIVLFPDTSDVLDAPQTGKHEFYPKGGTTVAELQSAGDSISSLALGAISAEPAAIALEKSCKVAFETLDMPIGLSATDRFIMALSQVAGVKVPDEITAERGRLVDVMADMEQYLYGKRVALFGDPDQLLPLTEFLLDLNMKPVHIVSGTPGQRFEKQMRQLLDARSPETKFRNGLQADMFLLHQWMKNEPVDLLIGNTYGKYIARDEDVPFIRFGFPILDRIGHSYFPNVGYSGGLRLVEKLLNAVMDRQDRDALEEKFELVM